MRARKLRRRYGQRCSDKLLQGLSQGHRRSEFDSKQLAAGTRVEMEHTTRKAVAERIAMDHLTEDPSYYRKLRRMERA